MEKIYSHSTWPTRAAAAAELSARLGKRITTNTITDWRKQGAPLPAGGGPISQAALLDWIKSGKRRPGQRGKRFNRSQSKYCENILDQSGVLQSDMDFVQIRFELDQEYMRDTAAALSRIMDDAENILNIAKSGDLTALRNRFEELTARPDLERISRWWEDDSDGENCQGEPSDSEVLNG